MDALHAKGYITDPKKHRESVYLTDEGMVRAKDLAKTLFESVPDAKSSRASTRG